VRVPHRRVIGALTAAVATLAAGLAEAQAFTPPKGLLALTFAWQLVENTGHRLDDGTVLLAGQSVDTGVLLEGEYAFTDRLALSLGLPYLFARYVGDGPTPGQFLPVDSCRCWHSSFQDFTVRARYRLGRGSFAVTPSVGLVVPSHEYESRGEAVVGRDLNEVQIGVGIGIAPRRGALAGLDFQATYSYGFVERVLDVPNDRSLGSISAGWTPARRLHVQLTANWQVTHGGLRFPADVVPLVPENPYFAEHDRLLRDDYWRLGGGLAYSFERFDVFASYSGYVAGTNSHAGYAVTAGVSSYFGGPLGR
jgi:hypothetical protein